MAAAETGADAVAGAATAGKTATELPFPLLTGIPLRLIFRAAANCGAQLLYVNLHVARP